MDKGSKFTGTQTDLEKLAGKLFGEDQRGIYTVATDIEYGPDGALSINSLSPRPEFKDTASGDNYVVNILLPKSDCQIVPAYIQKSPTGPKITISGQIAHDWIVNHYASQNLANYQILDRPGPLDLNKSLILLSGPIGNVITKSILGYQGSGNFLDLARDAFLPYEQVENEHECASIIRRYENGGIVEQPNWFIRSSDGVEIIPEFDDDNFAMTEYLLVTHLINHATTGRCITIFSGTQGLGTSCAGRIMAQAHLMESVARQLDGRDTNFQSLFRLRNLQHDHQARITSVSGGIEHVATNVFEMPAN